MQRLWIAALLVGCSTPAPAPGPIAGPIATPQEASTSPTVQEARAFYGSQPPYLQPVPHQETPAGLPDLRSATCGTCHADIYAEWRISTHARAWKDDPQFQAELHKSRQPEHDVGWMCVNCHTPLENQLPRLVARLDGGALDRPVYVENPNFDPVLQDDAIGCATCHVRDGAVLGPFGDTAAPHPTRKAPELLEVATCTRCHQASVNMPSVNLACAFETGEEWEAGPYDEEGSTCQACHMPAVARSLVAGGPVRNTRRHWFGGSLLAKQPRFEAELEPLKAVYPDGLALEWAAEPTLTTAGGVLRIALTNAEAGHMLPTGDPERFLRIEASLHAGGEERWRDGVRIGQTWRWHPTAEKLDDNRLRPRERRVVELTVPALPGGDYELVLEASKWRLNQENLGFHDLEGKTIAGRSTHRETRRLQIR